MRKVTEQTTSAFINKAKCRVGNTVSTGNELILFGKVIAKRINKKIYISNCGYDTKTTKERLNGLLSELGISTIYQKNSIWYWKDGKEFPFDEYVLVK